MAVRLLLEGALQVAERRVRIAGAQRHRRGVDPLGGRLRAGRPLRRLAFADPEVEPGALDELALLGVALEHLAERLGGAGVVVPLQPPDAALVDGDRLVEAGLLRRRWRRRRRDGLGRGDGCRLHLGRGLRRRLRRRPSLVPRVELRRRLRRGGLRSRRLCGGLGRRASRGFAACAARRAGRRRGRALAAGSCCSSSSSRARRADAV